MTIAELIEALSKFPPDSPVVLSRDAEGNGFSLLDEPVEAMWYEEYGETFVVPEAIADPSSSYTEEDAAPEGSVRAVVLWPV